MKSRKSAIEQTFQEFAKEPIEVQEITSAFYAFGSELAVLRIFAKYQTNGKYFNAQATIGYSEPRKSHYFCLDKGLVSKN